MSVASIMNPTTGRVSAQFLPTYAPGPSLVLENADASEITLVAGPLSSATLNCAGGLLVNADGSTVSIKSSDGQIVMPKPGTDVADGILFTPDTVNCPNTICQMVSFDEEGEPPLMRIQMVPNGPGGPGLLFTPSIPVANGVGTLNGGDAVAAEIGWLGCVNVITYSGTGEAVVQLSSLPTVSGLMFDLIAVGPLTSANRIRIENISTPICYITKSNTWTRLFSPDGNTWYGFTMPAAPNTF